MKSLFLLPEFRIFLSLLLLLLCLIATNELINYYTSNRGNDEVGKEDLYDENGNHIYYDRSIIKKNKFIRENPSVSPQYLRSFRRLIKEIFH